MLRTGRWRPGTLRRRRSRTGGAATPDATPLEVAHKKDALRLTGGPPGAAYRAGAEISQGAGGENDKNIDSFAEGIPVTLRRRVSHFLYGPFREHLNRLEEKTAYRKRFVLAFQQALDVKKPDAVYERYALEHHEVAAICNKRGIPHVLEVNALLARELAIQGVLSPRTRKKICDREYDFLRNQTQKVLVVSSKLKKEIGEELAHIVVNPNGVNVDAFSPAISPLPVLKRYGLENVPVLGWVGSFGRGRGVEEFLDIAARIHKIRPDVRFLLIGDGALKVKVHQAVKSNNLKKVFILTGSVIRTEIPAHIAAMDIALAPYPSYGAEYFSPLKVFEYMAMAKPIAATAIGQCVDLLQDDVGLLLPPEQPEVWAEEIVDLLKDKGRCEEMGKRARARVMKHYTWKRNAERIIKHLKALRTENRRGKP